MHGDKQHAFAAKMAECRGSNDLIRNSQGTDGMNLFFCIRHALSWTGEQVQLLSDVPEGVEDVFSVYCIT